MTTARDDFWTLDGDDIEHVHGNHWGVFFPDPGEILPEFLPLVVQQGAVWIDRMARPLPGSPSAALLRSEEHTSELQSLMRISYAVFCLKKKKTQLYNMINTTTQ